MSVYDQEPPGRSVRSGASASEGGSIAPGKRTMTQSLGSSSQGDTVEAKLERFERQLDLVEDLGPALLSRLAASDACALAGTLHMQLEELKSLREALRLSRTTAKRKGLATPLAEALQRADTMLDTYQPIVDSVRQTALRDLGLATDGDGSQETQASMKERWTDLIAHPAAGSVDAASAPVGARDPRNGAAPVQLLASAAQPSTEAARDPADVQEFAAAGVAGPGAPLPHLDPIQRSFGRHDVSRVQAHVGGEAAGAARAIGAQAYATGNDVAFVTAPDLHTTAHEVAHVMQQRSGVQLKGGVGQAGDAHEHHADQVADAVVRGESVEHLFEPRRQAAGTAVQRREGDRDERDLILLQLDAIATAASGALARIREHEQAGEEPGATDAHIRTTAEGALADISDRLSTLGALSMTPNKKLKAGARLAGQALVALFDASSGTRLDAGAVRAVAADVFAHLGVDLGALDGRDGAASFTGSERVEAVKLAIEVAGTRLTRAVATATSAGRVPEGEVEVIAAVLTQAQDDLRGVAKPARLRAAVEHVSAQVGELSMAAVSGGAAGDVDYVVRAVTALRVMVGLPPVAVTNAPATAPQGARSSSEPASKTDTTRVSSPHTGVPYVDDGTLCEQEGTDQERCFLTETKRSRLVDVLGHGVQEAMDNYRDALTEAKIEALTSDESSWGFLAEFLFGLASGGLIGVALKAVSAIRAAAKAGELKLDALDLMRGEEAPPATFMQRLAAVPDEGITTVLTNVSKGVRVQLKESAKQAAPGTAGKAAFIDIVRNRISEVSNMLITDAPASLDDYELSALRAAYSDGEAHSFAAYRATIADMLARFGSQRIADAGTSAPDGTGWKRVVQLRCGRVSRLALVEGTLSAGTPNAFNYSGWGRFLNFIDDAFASVAIDTYVTRTGGTIEEVDVTNGHPFVVDQVYLTDPSRNIDAWIEELQVPEAGR